MEKELWPTLRFPPINLLVVIPARMFYIPHEERQRMIWQGPDRGEPKPKLAAVPNPALEPLHAFLATR